MNHSFHSAHWKRYMNKPLISVVSGGMLFFYPQHSFAAPTEGNVTGGSATISQSGLATLINQGSARAVIDWRGFDISADERVQFIQANASAIALNRITGGNPTTILGQLAANGRVFISNPNGVVFGAGSKVDVAGLLATTLSINADEFMNGKTLFTKSLNNIPSFIVNQGEIHIADNGFCFLVAGGVQNAGTIIGQLGKVVLASADTLTLDFNGDGLVTYTVSGKVLQNIIGPDGKPFDAAVSNTGTISTPGGDIVMVGNGAKDAFSSVVNNSGVLEATSLNVKNGSVTLNAGDGDAVVTGSINVSGTGAGQVGGKVEVLGNRVGLFGNAAIDASGAAGGGTVLVGGDLHGQGGVPTASQTVVSTGTTIKANAIDAGDGGKVVVWADQSTSFNGTIEARGGTAGGNGGFVETSGKQTLAFNGNVDTRAPQGLTGTLLLDPTDITISTGTNNMTFSTDTFNVTATPSILNTTTLQTQLASTNVIVDTSALNSGSETGTITVLTPILDWANAKSLTLKAKSTLTTNANATITNSGTGALNFYADGAVNINAAVSLTNGAFTVAGYSGSGNALSFTAGPDCNISTGSGAINIASGSTLTMASLTTTGNVTLTAVDDIRQASTDAVISGATVSMEIKNTTLDASKSADVEKYVQHNIGTIAAPINTSATNLSATTEYGAIYITETDAVTINNLTAKFKGNAATMNASTGVVEAKAVDGTSAAANSLNVALVAGGDITLGTASSTATVSTPHTLSINSTGKVLDGNGANNNITASSVSIAATQIGSPISGSTPANAIEIQSPLITSATASAGDIYLALAGKSTVTTITSSGNIGLSNAIGNLTLGGIITANSGNGELTIVNNTGTLLSSSSSLLANTVRLSARDGIGTSGAKISTAATALIT